MKKFLLLMGLMTTSSTAFAMFCPSNFNSINLGDTAAQVELQCGPPASKKNSKITSNVPQEWTYYIITSPTDQGSLKFTFAFIDDKIVNITSNGVNVAATSLCNSSVILQLGNTTKQVESTCGKPAIINKTDLQGPAETRAPIEMSEWLYTGGTPATLIFENGKLKERR